MEVNMHRPSVMKDAINIVFFDLETQHTFQELGMGFYNRNPTKLKLAVAGIITNEGHLFFQEDEVDELFRTLSRADKIVGHNLFRFDYLVLEPYLDFSVQKSLKTKTFDTMRELEKKTGCWVGLDALGRLNLGMAKTVNPLKVPKMWREGKHDEVRSYLLNDLKMLKGIFEHGKKFGKLKYEHREYGVDMGTREVPIEW
jgi:hypothetical protein